MKPTQTSIEEGTTPLDWKNCNAHHRMNRKEGIATNLMCCKWI